jgi:hypothetical protein
VNEAIPISEGDCFGFYANYTPSSILASGVDDADIVIYVAAGEDLVIEAADGSIGNLCDQDKRILAFAFACSLDQFDRPVIGAINFCLGNILSRLGSLAETVVPTAKIVHGNDPKADVFYVATHEVAHVLGFALDLFKNFRDPETGEPLTPRPFVPTNVTCVNGTIQNMVWPANNTIQAVVNWDDRTYCTTKSSRLG